ncbi:bifunctional metallophosphatase/5'-nucleotidase [Nonomuraea sp. NPDC050310]|uniref:bifunctional metallophosphatase/5'-nucleotidase n=1 Tax=Nonomuraea sp. NPDC050310 TaxID=3154935 RepID=UPI0033C74DFD
MRSFRSRIAVVAAAGLVVLTGPATAAVAARPGPVDVQVLTLSDLHGYLTPQHNATDGTIKDPTGKVLVVGGAPYIATHLERLRAGRDHTLTLAAGDFFSGWPTEVAYHADEPTIEFMNKIKVDVAAVGNHELDRSLEFLRDHMGKGKCFGEIGVDSCFTDSDGQPFRGADFPFSTANIVRKGQERPVLPPYVIKRFGRVAVGVINLTTVTTVEGSTSYQPGLDNLPLVETAGKYAAELKRRGVEAIVANVHEGGYAGPEFDGCANLTGPIADFAARATPDIDAIVTGHWHWGFNCALPDPAGDLRPVVEPANHGRLINELNLKIDPRTRDVIRSATTSANHAVTRDVPPDPDMTELVEYWLAKGAESYARPVGALTGDVTRVRDADGESTLGNLAADVAHADSHRTPGGAADLAMVAVAPVKGSNSLRADLKFAKGANPADADGTVLFGEAWAAWGYANPVLTVSVTGAQIEQALEQQWQTQPNGTVRFAPLAVSGNVRFSYDLSKPVGDRVLPADVLIGGVPLDPTRGYRLAALAYTLIGADGYTAFAGFTDAVRGSRDYEAFRDYLARGPLTPPALDRAIAKQL